MTANFSKCLMALITILILSSTAKGDGGIYVSPNISGAKLVSSDPPCTSQGRLIINTTSSLLKVCYAGSWDVVATLTPVAGNHILTEDSNILSTEDGKELITEQ